MKIVIMAYVFAIVSLTVLGQENYKRTEAYNLHAGIALSGYDPVSYFDGRPIKGKPTFKHTYEGVTYFFSSPDNKARFISEPEKYEPEYGGWCAFAMGDSGKKVEVDPETYKIINGKLYLFYNKLGNNTLDDWNKNEKALRAKADANWQKILNK